jgi:ubiquinone/menaquinone biosynthesis C-methylase UbiE
MADTFKDGVKPDVWRMYMDHPYPNYTRKERENIFAAELCRYRYLGLEPFMRGARIADIGCGTGHRVIPMAQHFGVNQYLGLDHSSASLHVAEELCEELGIKNAALYEGDVFKLPFEDGSFDIVICQGVLHHTSDPYRGFKELVRICRPGGFINVYPYNRYNHWRHNLQKAKVSRLGGSNLANRFEVAHRLYGVKPIVEMTPAEIAGFYDQYCHPHESDHTIGGTLAWFDDQRLQYWGAYPPMRIGDFVGMAQYRGELLAQYPNFHTKLARRIVALSLLFPSMEAKAPPFKRPNIFDRFFWQFLYAFQGSRGRYSGGPSLCAKKSQSELRCAS